MKILLMDDSFEFAEPVKELLERDGHTVDVIDDSDDAYDKTGDIAGYDIIILDLMFVVGDKFKLEDYPEVGVLLYKRIREKNNEVPIIIVSALKPNRRLEEYWIDDAFVKYVSKPLSANIEDLGDAIKSLAEEVKI